MPDDLQQNFAALNQKLDMFMQYYKDMHVELERRVSKVEQRVDVIDDKMDGLHENSMKWVRDAIQELERRISDKIEANSKFSRSNWLIVGIATVSSLLSLGTMIVMIVALFR